MCLRLRNVLCYGEPDVASPDQYEVCYYLTSYLLCAVSCLIYGRTHYEVGYKVCDLRLLYFLCRYD